MNQIMKNNINRRSTTTRLSILACRAIIFSVLCACHASHLQASDPVEVAGYLEPMQDVQLAFPEPGILRSLEVKVGDLVESGTIMARLDDVIQKSDLRLSEAKAAARGAYEATLAEHTLQTERTQRIRELRQLDMARPDELMRAEKELEVLDGRLKALREDRELLYLEVERAKLQIERRYLVAPFDGTVSEILHHPGEHISSFEPAMFRFIDTSRMLAVVNVPAIIMPNIRCGDSVLVRSTVPIRTFRGTIDSIAPAIHGESGTIRVKVRVDNTKGDCRAGDECTVIFNSMPIRSALRPPQSRESR